MNVAIPYWIAMAPVEISFGHHQIINIGFNVLNIDTIFLSGKLKDT